MRRSTWSLVLVLLVASSVLLLAACTDEDKEDWKSAEATNVVAAYEQYLQDHPDGDYAGLARERVDLLDWEEASTLNTVDAFEAYLEDHPDGTNATEARERVDDLSWKAAADAGTIASYQHYLSSYPSGKFTQQAEQAIASLTEDDSPFLAAQQEGSRAAYDRFLAEFPGHRREADALRALDEIAADMKGQHLVDLIDQGKVEARPKGAGIQNVSVEVRRLVNHDVTVLIPAATFFVAGASVQSMVTTGEARLVLSNDGWQAVSVPAACADLHLDVPGTGDSFQVQRSPHQQELERVVEALSTAGSLDAGTRQAVVWIVTDNANYEDLGILVSGPIAGFGSRVINETKAAQAMKIVDDAGIDITTKAIWWDRTLILQGVQDQALRTWLQQRAG